MPVEIVVVKRPRGGPFAALRSLPSWWRALWLDESSQAATARTRVTTTAWSGPASAQSEGLDAPRPPADFSALRATLAQLVRAPARPTGEAALRIELAAAEAPALLRRLREDPALGFDRLFDLTAIDWLGPGLDGAARFEIVYCLEASASGFSLRVHVHVAGEPPELESVTSLWPSASWLEREASELFDVRFRGHPGLQRLLLPADLEGAPLRKDHDRVGELREGDGPATARRAGAES